jgi:hypothetical protein
MSLQARRIIECGFEHVSLQSSRTRSPTTEGAIMATLTLQTRRLLVAGGFAVSVVAAPAFIELLADTERERITPLASCPAGEEPDHFTGQCVPHTVPNSPASTSPFQSIPGNPNIPAVSLPDGGGAIPCTGRNVGQCIALSEVGGPPRVTPESQVGGSPTVTGRVGP